MRRRIMSGESMRPVENYAYEIKLLLLLLRAFISGTSLKLHVLWPALLLSSNSITQINVTHSEKTYTIVEGIDRGCHCQATLAGFSLTGSQMSLLPSVHHVNSDQYDPSLSVSHKGWETDLFRTCI